MAAKVIEVEYASRPVWVKGGSCFRLGQAEPILITSWTERGRRGDLMTMKNVVINGYLLSGDDPDTLVTLELKGRAWDRLRKQLDVARRSGWDPADLESWSVEVDDDGEPVVVWER